MKEFKDRIAVVTGAASGIGLAMVERFAAEGMKVVLADIDEELLTAAWKRLEAKGVPALAVPVDVSRAGDVERLARRTLDCFGRVDIVCNNAAVGTNPAFSWERPIEDWKWAFNVNVWGVIHGIRTFVPILLEQNTVGHIVNTASGAGFVSFPFLSEYHASKFAVVAISESLHHELEAIHSQVKASLLCPGFVRTNIQTVDHCPVSERPVERRLSKPAQAWKQMVEELIAAGQSPSVVADCVLQAIKEERFYVFPQPEILEGVHARLGAIIEGRKPVLALPEELQRRLGF